MFPLQSSQQALDQWQQGDKIFTDTPQMPKVDQVERLPKNFWSYLEAFDDYSSYHLDLSYEDDYQPPLCLDFDRSKNIVCLKKDSHDLFLQLSAITLPRCFIKGIVGKCVFYIEFPLKKTLEYRGWSKTMSSGLSSQCFNLPLRVGQSSIRSLSIPSRDLECEDVLGRHFTNPQSQCSEPWTFHDPF